jgi:hypothetical protein
MDSLDEEHIFSEEGLIDRLVRHYGYTLKEDTAICDVCNGYGDISGETCIVCKKTGRNAVKILKKKS